MHTASARYWEGDDDDMDKAGLVHARIRAALLAHRVPPGTQLNIRSIAKSMKVSPTPVREALIRLADEDIVIVAAGRGFFTKPLNVRELMMDYETRQMIASFAIARHIAGFSMEGLTWPLQSQTDGAMPNLDVRRAWMDLIHDLFERIAGLTLNTRLIRLVKQINDRTAQVLDLDFQHPGRFEEIEQSMSTLIANLLDRDVAGALANLEAQSLARASVLRDLVKEGNARALEAGPVEFAFL